MPECQISWGKMFHWPDEGAWGSGRVLEEERGVEVAAIHSGNIGKGIALHLEATAVEGL